MESAKICGRDGFAVKFYIGLSQDLEDFLLHGLVQLHRSVLSQNLAGLITSGEPDWLFGGIRP